MNLTVPDYPAAFWITAAIGVMLFGISKAGFAGGVGMLATPLVALTITVAEAAALLLPLLIIIDILALFYYRRDFDRKSIKITIPGSLLGILVGSLFFGWFAGKDQVLRLGIGLLALIFVVFQVARGFILGKMSKRHPGTIEGLSWSAIAGFTSTISHAGGPPLAIYLLPQRFPKHIYVGTTAVFFAVTNAVKLLPYAALGILRPSNFIVVALLSPLCLVSVRIGVWLNRRFDETWFTRLVYTVLFLSALQLIWSGLSNLDR
jgi:hypothetical protein